MAGIAYRHQYFNSEEGLKHLSRKTQPTTSPIAVKSASEFASSILNEAKANSDYISRQGDSLSSTLNSNPLVPPLGT